MVWFDNVISNLSISLISFTVTNKKICSFEDSYIAMVLVKNLFKTMYRWYTQCVQCEKRKVFFFILFFLNSCVYQLCGNAFNTIYLSLTLQKCKKETWGGGWNNIKCFNYWLNCYLKRFKHMHFTILWKFHEKKTLVYAVKINQVQVRLTWREICMWFW